MRRDQDAKKTYAANAKSTVPTMCNNHVGTVPHTCQIGGAKRVELKRQLR